LKNETVVYGGSATAPSNPSRAGYTFTGWDRSFVNVVSDLIVTAQYASSSGSGGVSSSGSGGSGSSSVVWFVVRFVDWDGVLLKSERVRSGGDATAPGVSTREGYIFTGWDLGFTNVRSDLTVTAQYTPEPIVPQDEPVLVWALVNLVLSVVGIILAVIVLLCVLLRERQKQKKQQENQQKVKRQNMAEQRDKQQENKADEKKQQKQCRVWLFAALTLATVGIIVFLLTEDMNRKMAMVDRWTIVNAVIFIAEIIALFFVFKRNKNNDKDNKPVPENSSDALNQQ
jgi:uncharacterized repeat protein (TIGR02543 family)